MKTNRSIPKHSKHHRAAKRRVLFIKKINEELRPERFAYCGRARENRLKWVRLTQRRKHRTIW